MELSEKVRDIRVSAHCFCDTLYDLWVTFQQKAESDAAAEKAAGDLTANDVAHLQQQLKQLQIEQIIGQRALVNLADPHAAVAK